MCPKSGATNARQQHRITMSSDNNGKRRNLQQQKQRVINHEAAEEDNRCRLQQQLQQRLDTEIPIVLLAPTTRTAEQQMTTKHWLLSSTRWLRRDQSGGKQAAEDVMIQFEGPADHLLLSSSSSSLSQLPKRQRRRHSVRQPIERNRAFGFRWRSSCLYNMHWLLSSMVLLVVLFSDSGSVRTVSARSGLSSSGSFTGGSSDHHHHVIPRGCKWQRLTTTELGDGSLVTNYEDVLEELAVHSAASSDNEAASKEILSCKLRTIDSLEGMFGNVSGHQADRISALHLECSDVLFYESALQPQQPSSQQSQPQSGAFLGALRRLQELQIEYCKIRLVPSLVLAQLFELRRLSLRTHNADWAAMNLEFHRDSFQGLANLQDLDLAANNIWTLPSDVFCPMTRLRQLNLSFNRLTDVGQLGFSDWGSGPMAPGRSCNTGLETLDLAENSVTTLPDNGFSALRSLSSLSMQGNHLTSLADRSFVGLQSLKVLNMSSNRLMALPPELFQSPRMLQYLDLHNNSLRVLAPGLLEGLDRLEELDLAINELTSEWVNRNTFAGLIRLVVLKLGFNQLTKIDHNVFRGLYSLQVLNLEHNHIESIAENAFVDLKNLHILTLSHNQMKQLDAFHFSELYVLSQLMLDNNRIETVHERAFENITHLSILYLNDNHLDEIPNLSRLKFLSTLDLGKNRIKSVRNESFEGLEELTGLRLTDNLIQNISRDAFITLSSLHVLNLASNRISHIDQSAFIASPILKAIRLDDNQLEDISSVFTSLSSLVWLNVSGNRLRWFDYSHFPTSLEWLDMHENNVSELGNYFDVGNKLQLKMLDISHNKLTFIVDASIPNSIETLYLNNNEIEDVAAGTFASKPYLQKVVLYGNRLRRLEIAALALPPIAESQPMPQFYMGHNPFHCDCNLEWLQRINDLSYLRQHPHVADLDQIQCATLEHQQRSSAPRPITQLQPGEFLCRYESHCFTLCHCCDFDACDCKMTCPDRCSCYHDHSWSANIVDCGGAGYSQIPHKIPMDATTIYLDGNNLEHLASHQFIGKKKLEALYLNGSNINALLNGTFNGVLGLKVLHLEGNKVRQINGPELSHLTNLRDVSLDNNQLRGLGRHTFTKMKHLERLSMAGNTQITDFDLWQQLGGAFASGSLQRLSLEGVRLRCDCESLLKFRDWQKFIVVASEQLGSINALLCNSGKVLGEVMKRCQENNQNVVNVGSNSNSVGGSSGDSNQVTNDDTTPNVQRTVFYDKVDPASMSSGSGFIGGGYIPLLSAIVAALIGTALLLTLVCVFRQDVRVWAHSKYGVRLFRDPEARAAHADGCGKQKLYDAYVVYNIRDADFTHQILAGELQHNGYALCLHHRDIHVSPFLETVENVADISRKIVIVVSLNFVHNEWQQPQFRIALQTLIESVASVQRRHKFLLVLTAPVELIVVDHLMQILLRTCSVVCWGEKRFWAKLRYLLPDISAVTNQGNSGGGGGNGGSNHQTGGHNHNNNSLHRLHHNHQLHGEQQQQLQQQPPLLPHNHHHHMHHHHQAAGTNAVTGHHHHTHAPSSNCRSNCGKPMKNGGIVGGGGNSILSGNCAGNASNLRYTPAPTTLDSWHGKLSHSGGLILASDNNNSSSLDAPLFQPGGGLMGSPNLSSINNLNGTKKAGTAPSISNNVSPSASLSAASNTEEDDDEDMDDGQSTASSQHYEAPPNQQLYIPTTASSLGHVYSTIPETASSQSPPLLMMMGITANPASLNGLDKCNSLTGTMINSLAGCKAVAATISTGSNENGRAYFV